MKLNPKKEKFMLGDWMLIWTAVGAIGSFLSALLVVGTFIFSLKAIRQTDNTNRINLVSDMQKRYDAIRYDVLDKTNEDCKQDPNSPKNVKKAKEFFYRYWDLMSEEFSAWKQGVIDEETFSSWMEFRKREWDENFKVGSMSYRDGWNDFKNYLGKSEFVEFMGQVFDETTPDPYEGGIEGWTQRYQKIGK